MKIIKVTYACKNSFQNKLVLVTLYCESLDILLNSLSKFSQKLIVDNLHIEQVK